MTLEQEVAALTKACRDREDIIRNMRDQIRLIHSALDDFL